MCLLRPRSIRAIPGNDGNASRRTLYCGRPRATFGVGDRKRMRRDKIKKVEMANPGDDMSQVV
jgi:hypothetical protein